MVSLTPIQLSQEEHDRLTALKHQLKAKSWKDMLMKLCDICEGKKELPKPFQTTEEYIENLIEEKLEQKLENRKEKEDQNQEEPFTKMLKNLGNEKEGGKEMDEETVRRIIREELANHKFEVEIPAPEKPKVETEPCEGCGTEVPKGQPHCHGCGGELDWEE